MSQFLAIVALAKPFVIAYGPFALAFAAGHVTNPALKSAFSALADLLKSKQEKK